MSLIEDGIGSGHKAGVDGHNRLLTAAITQSSIHFTSENYGLAFGWTAISAALAVNDTALLVCNTDPNRAMHVDSIYIYSDTPTQVKIHFPVYSASFTGTAVTGLNMNRTSNIVALAQSFADETTNALVAGNVILTLATNELTGDQFGITMRDVDGIVLGYHDSIAVDVVAGAAAFECTIWGYYTEE